MIKIVYSGTEETYLTGKFLWSPKYRVKVTVKLLLLNGNFNAEMKMKKKRITEDFLLYVTFSIDEIVFTNSLSGFYWRRNSLFENKVLGRIFRTEREEVKRGWTKLHNEELHNLYCLQSIIREMKSRKMRRAGHRGFENCMQHSGHIT
jgi:hypothetical protein